VSACSKVSDVDVDGDARPDQVAVRRLADSEGQQVWQLRVLTAAGTLSSVRSGPDVLYDDTPWFGAGAVDGAPGAELLLRMSSGPHTQWFRMYSWRNGKLALQRAPDADPTYQDGGWVIDAAFSAYAGTRCSTAGGTALLDQASLSPADGEQYLDDPDAVYEGEIVRYAWKGNRWLRQSTTPLRVPASSSRIAELAGWHCAGLPVGLEVSRSSGTERDENGCQVGSPVDDAMCLFMRAVQSGNLSELYEGERRVAAEANDLPRRDWRLEQCELEGDVTVRCEVAFPTGEASSEDTVATFYLSPTNGEYSDGRIILPEGENLRYEVSGYAGLGV
jgi:hypothetical protein